MKAGKLDMLRERGGALIGPATRLLQRLAQEREVPQAGGEALLALAETLEDWCAEEALPDYDEDALVEAAGAWLGLLLIDHLGPPAAHTSESGLHRIRVGARGYFDPFRAVETALDAPDPRKALAEEVARAEAEARGQGPLSRVVGSLESALARHRPDLCVETQFDAQVRLSDGTEIDLRRTVRATCGEAQNTVDSALVRLVSLLPSGAHVEAPLDAVRAQLLPRLCPRERIEALAAGGVGRLWSAPWRGPVCIALVIEHGDRVRYVADTEAQAWNAAPEALLSCAVANLAGRSGDVRWARVDTPEGPVVMSRSGDGHDAARALLPGLYGVLSCELGERMWLGLPHRDLLMACPDGDPALRDAVRARVARDHARAPHGLSPQLFSLDARGVAGAPPQALRARASTSP